MVQEGRLPTLLLRLTVQHLLDAWMHTPSEKGQNTLTSQQLRGGG